MPVLLLGDLIGWPAPAAPRWRSGSARSRPPSAYLLFASGLRHLPANEVATLTLAEPVTATLLGAIVLGERPGAVAVAGDRG